MKAEDRTTVHTGKFLALIKEGRWEYVERVDPLHPGSLCSWVDDGFKLHLSRTKAELFAEAHDFVKSVAWVEGIGANEKYEVKASPHHGLFTAKGENSGNPPLEDAVPGQGKSAWHHCVCR